MRRVVVPGVKFVEERAFDNCVALTDVDVECSKLAILLDTRYLFSCCKSLRSVNIPSARIVVAWYPKNCEELN